MRAWGPRVGGRRRAGPIRRLSSSKGRLARNAGSVGRYQWYQRDSAPETRKPMTQRTSAIMATYHSTLRAKPSPNRRAITRSASRIAAIGAPFVSRRVPAPRAGQTELVGHGFVGVEAP